MRFFLIAAALVGCTYEGQLRSRVEPPIAPTDDDATDPSSPRSCRDGVTDVVTLSFAAREGCAFSTDGNLEPRNEFLQARSDEARFVPLPTGALLCDLSLRSIDDAVSFDDHFALLVNDVVLVSGGSGGALSAHGQVSGLPRFDWETLRGRPFADRYTPYECLGGGTCVVPRTEEFGPLDVEVDPDTMEAIVEALGLTDGFDVHILTFGDDDWGDCANTEVELEAVVRYVP